MARREDNTIGGIVSTIVGLIVMLAIVETLSPGFIQNLINLIIVIIVLTVIAILVYILGEHQDWW